MYNLLFFCNKFSEMAISPFLTSFIFSYLFHSFNDSFIWAIIDQDTKWGGRYVNNNTQNLKRKIVQKIENKQNKNKNNRKEKKE